MTNRALGGIVIDVEIKQGRNLVPKDRKLSSLGAMTTSDPFVKVYGCKKFVGKTKVCPATLNPEWNQKFQLVLGMDDANYVFANNGEVKMEFRIFDADTGKDHDPMGTVRVPLKCMQSPATKWYQVLKGKGRYYCKDARGGLQIYMSVSIRKMLSLVRGNNHILEYQHIKIGLSWDMENGEEVDLDTSCVAIDNKGRVVMKDTVYYGNLGNRNLSVVHSGDQQDGQAQDDDESIICYLNKVPPKIKALYFLVTVATPGKTFMNVQSTKVRVLELGRQQGICQFSPSDFGSNTTMFLLRVARNPERQWVLSIIEDFDSQSRCFGSLIPEIKSYTSDLIPNIVIDPMERVAVLRKGEQVRIKDFARGKIPKWVAFGLQWDVTDGVNIDLDASAVCLARDLRPLDVVFFKQLRSKDNSIRHSGDEQKGDESGDDEKILISLPNTSRDIHYIAFVINSYSGQELDDIAKASCHLYDVQTSIDIATYSISNASELDKHTALLVGCLFREGPNTWNLRIISKPLQGKTAHDNVEDLQKYLFKNPPSDPQVTPNQSARILNTMPPPVKVPDGEVVMLSTDFEDQYCGEEAKQEISD